MVHAHDQSWVLNNCSKGGSSKEIPRHTQPARRVCTLASSLGSSYKMLKNGRAWEVKSYFVQQGIELYTNHTGDIEGCYVIYFCLADHGSNHIDTYLNFEPCWSQYWCQSRLCLYKPIAMKTTYSNWTVSCTALYKVFCLKWFLPLLYFSVVHWKTGRMRIYSFHYASTYLRLPKCPTPCMLGLTASTTANTTYTRSN